MAIVTVSVVPGRRPSEAAQDALEEEADRGRQHAEHEERAPSGTGMPVTRFELVVGEGRDHPDRAVGEVEDAGGRVGEHEAGRRDGEHAAAADPDEGELQEGARRAGAVEGADDQPERERASRRRPRSPGCGRARSPVGERGQHAKPLAGCCLTHLPPLTSRTWKQAAAFFWAGLIGATIPPPV